VIGPSDTSLYQGVQQFAKRHGLNVQQLDRTKSLRAQGVPEVEGELGRADDPGRRRELAKALSRRTTESSRKRLLNRILSGYGLRT
jgi:hypothetical protein